MFKIIFYLFIFILLHNFYLSLFLSFILFLFLFKIIKSDKSLIQNVKNNKNKKNIFITFLIPIYDEEKNLKKLINSIFMNNNENIEIIFIDDSSKDNSLNILKYYQELYQFKIIHLDKQKLVSDVLNKGLLYIDNKTSHIGILNGDCYVPNNFFEMIKERLMNYDIDVLNVNNKVLNYEKNNIWNYFSYLEKDYKNYIFNYIESSLNNGYIIDKNLLYKLNGWKSITEDLNLNLKIKSKNIQIYHEPNINVYDTIPDTFSKLLKQKFRWMYGDLTNRIKFNEKNLFDIIVNIYYIFPFYFLCNLIFNNLNIYHLQIQIILTELILYYKSKKYNINYLFESIIYACFQFSFQLYFYIKLIFKLFIDNNKITW